MRSAAFLSLLWLVSCAGYRPARFAELPPVLDAKDEQPIAAPRWRWQPEPVYLSEVYLHRPLREALDLSPFPDAGDVNSFDEVVRSSWYVPRVLDVGAMARGPDSSGPPRPPFTVLPDASFSFDSGGFMISDARGMRYEIAVDPPDRPEMRTGAAAVAARLLWALGYNTPPIFVVDASPDDFWRSEAGADDVAKILKSGPPPINGYCRIAALSWPTGIVVGRALEAGTRIDDPNDVIAHEDRRSLRALLVIASWLQLDDLGPAKTLDRYIGAPGEGHVVHYVVGLDDALGAGEVVRATDPPPREGGGSPLVRLLTLGLAPNPAPPPTQTELLNIGQLDLDVDPRSFHPSTPWEPAVRIAPTDGYWAAKLIGRLSSTQIALAIDAGKLGDERARRYLQRMLERRRTEILAYWYGRVVPVEPIAVNGNRLLFRDEAVASGVAPANVTDYKVEFLTTRGTSAADAAVLHPTGATLEVTLSQGAMQAARDYLVVHIAGLRGKRAMRRTFELHLKIMGGKLVVLGIRH
jgi:hypothetical protein